MRNMRKQLYATLACFLLTSVTTYGQGWKLYEEAAKGESYAKFDCVALLDSTSVSVQPTGQGSFAVCKVIKVQTPKGAVANRVIKYDYDPLTAHAEFKRVTIYHADGQIEEVDVKKTCDYAAPARAIYWGARQIMIEVGALNPGDVIDYEIAKKGLHTLCWELFLRMIPGSYLPCVASSMTLFHFGAVSLPCVKCTRSVFLWKKRCNFNFIKENVHRPCVMKTDGRLILLLWRT